MKANTLTPLGIYLGTGIGQFPTMHCFQRDNGRSFRYSLNGINEISSDQYSTQQAALNDAKETFFAALPSISLD